jgi:carbonic anhydrase/acetyltransferase-like protein (isoleucine patch superfamily)
MPVPLFTRTSGNYFVAHNATIVGEVAVGELSSFWFNAVVRGDVAPVTIGRRVNVQDGVVVHCDTDVPNVIEDDVTIGHGAIVHACTVGDACLIGMNATVLDGAVINRHSLVAAGAVIAPGKIVGEGELWVGNPARCARKLTGEEIEKLYYSAQHYVKLKNRYLD